MFEYLKALFGRLTLLQMASAELAEAEVNKMKAHSVQEYATATINAEILRIKRLKAQINELSKEKQK